MSHTLGLGLFLVLIAALATLIMWEWRQRRRGPSISSQAYRSRLAGSPRLPYVPPRGRRSRSMDGTRLA